MIAPCPRLFLGNKLDEIGAALVLAVSRGFFEAQGTGGAGIYTGGVTVLAYAEVALAYRAAVVGRILLLNQTKGAGEYTHRTTDTAVRVMQNRAGGLVNIERFGHTGLYTMRVIAMTALQGEGATQNRFDMNAGLGKHILTDNTKQGLCLRMRCNAGDFAGVTRQTFFVVNKDGLHKASFHVQQ
jgi:hypothetical protein